MDPSNVLRTPEKESSVFTSPTDPKSPPIIEHTFCSTPSSFGSGSSTNHKPPIVSFPNQTPINLSNLTSVPNHNSYTSASAPQPNEKSIRTRLFSGGGNTTNRLQVTSLTDFLRIELTRGYRVELEEERFTARREKVYTFISIPKELERFMSYGFFQCVDAFLYLFTFLPIRCLLAVRSILNNLLPYSSTRLQSNEKCDLLKLIVLTSCIFIFSYIDTSVMYHVIKSQSVIKLYIFFNMLEVGDRLFASFVQDTLDALFLTAVEKVDENSKHQHRMSLILHLLLTIFSVAGHALVLLCQGTTLNVAINSSNRALLTVMMSNNFVELKGAVFKKFDKLNLFQVSCSDVRERFHLCILLFVVCIQTMREYQWEESRFWILLPDCIMVMLAEIGVDWIKHAFVTRFNEISPQVYREYTLSLAFDLAQTKNRRAFSDSSDMVGRRLGFVPLPLAVVLFKVMRPSLKSLDVGNLILLVVMYFAVTSFRLLNSVVLLGKACTLIDHHHGKTKSESALEEELPEKQNHDLLSRTFRSHPTTRTPSPSRIATPTSNDGSGSSPESPSKRPATGGSFSASQSVSTSPRASIAAVNNSDTCQLLFANSAVSILSMNLNEELFKKGKDSPNDSISRSSRKKNKTLHKRKYSLGSEFKFETTLDEEFDATLIPPSNTPSPIPGEATEITELTDGDEREPEIERILNDDNKPDEEDKENECLIPQAQSSEPNEEVEKASEAGDEEETSTSSSSSENKKKRKKGLSWLLHH